MPRPRKNRIVEQPPLFSSFKPAGQRARKLAQITLSLDEYEAIRLADYKRYEHSRAAKEMEISRSTFTRLVEIARRKIAEFIIEGKQLSISGGTVHFSGNSLRCLDCGEIFYSDFKTIVTECVNCGSNNIEDLARNFGHGKCCRKRQRRNRR